MYIEQHFDQFYLASTHHTEAITLSQAEHLLTHQINPINKIEKKNYLGGILSSTHFNVVMPN